MIDGATAMLVETRCFVGDIGLSIVFLLAWPQLRSYQEGSDFVKDARVAGRPGIVMRRKGKPKIIVGEARADTAAARRMPPMLDVAFDELPRRGAEEVLPRFLRPGVNQRHRILE